MFNFIPDDDHPIDEADEEGLSDFNATVDFMIMATARRRWNDWRHHLHKKSTKFDSLDDKVSNKPDDVEMTDWLYLLNHWESDKYKVYT